MLEVFSDPDDTRFQPGTALGWRFQGSRRLRLDAKFFQPPEDRRQGAFGIAEKDTAADPDEFPAEALQNNLPFHIFAQFIEVLGTLAITLDRKPAIGAHHDEADAI